MRHFKPIIRLHFVLRVYQTFKTLGDPNNWARCIDKQMKVEGRFSSV